MRVGSEGTGEEALQLQVGSIPILKTPRGKPRGIFTARNTTHFIYGRLPRRKQRGMRSLKRFKGSRIPAFALKRCKGLFSKNLIGAFGPPNKVEDQFLTGKTHGVRNTFTVGGAWRRLEAHLNGVQGVGGSNPLAPTKNAKQ